VDISFAGTKVYNLGKENKRLPDDDEAPFRIEITDVFDLHSVPPRDVRAVVEEYLELAYLKGFRAIRIIHGRGVGVQRNTVRTVLSASRYVVRFSDAPPEAGGWGATIATLGEATHPIPSQATDP